MRIQRLSPAPKGVTAWVTGILACVLGALSGTSLPCSVQAGTWPAVFDLSSLDGTNGFTIVGMGGDGTGNAVSGASDFNGDGIEDILVGGPGNNKNGVGSGAAYLVYGRASGFRRKLFLDSLTSKTGLRLYGVPGSGTGLQVANPGDVNGDGLSDLVIGAPRSVSTYLVFGTAKLRTQVNLSDLNGRNGFWFSGASPNPNSGVGDIQGDGFADVLVGADGPTYLIRGKSKFPAILTTRTVDQLFRGHRNGEGQVIGGAGDVNGDGFRDIVIGAPHVKTGTALRQPGAAYVVFGNVDVRFPVHVLRKLDGTNGFELDGARSFGGLGSLVDTAGDINADGFSDVIACDGKGRCYVVFGRASGFPAKLDVSTLDGTNGFAIISPSGINAVASAGDVNGDDISDVIIGVRGSTIGGAYVVFGKAGAYPSTIDLSTLDGTNGFFLKGDGDTGTSVSAADVNGDRASDMIIGSPGNPGKVFVVFGRP